MYSEEQKTPWYSVDSLPLRPGKYELREEGLSKVFWGLYADGRWKVAFGEPTFRKLSVTHSRMQWRGLKKDPRALQKPEAPVGGIRFVGF